MYKTSYIPQKRVLGVSLVTVLLAILAIFAWQISKPPPQAQAIGIPFIDTPNPCDLLPDGVITATCNAGRDPVGTAGSLVDRIPGVPNPVELPGRIVGRGLDAIADNTIDRFMRGLAVWLTRPVITLIKLSGGAALSVGSPDFRDPWFTQSTQTVFWLFYAAAVIAFVVAISRAAKDANIPAQFVALFKLGLFVFFAGGALISVVASFLNVIDNQMVPLLFESNVQKTQLVFDTLADKIGEAISMSEYTGLLLFVLILAWIFAGLTSIAMMVRFMLLPFLVLGVLFALAMNILGHWGEERLRNSVMLFIAWATYPWFLALATNISLDFLIQADSFKVAMFACLTVIMPFVIAGWILRWISQTKFGLVPMSKVAMTAAGWNNISKALSRA